MLSGQNNLSPHLGPQGQILSSLCALLSLGFRVPQLLLNHKRKSTDGVSMAFFLFTVVGCGGGGERGGCVALIAMGWLRGECR